MSIKPIVSALSAAFFLSACGDEDVTAVDYTVI